MPNTRHFSAATFRFLNDLADNNNRDWFKANSVRYERDLREPALQFIRDFAPRLEKISPHFRADDRKSGGSLFRIYRDVRFSKDKSPYKTSTGIQFRHEAGRDVHAPGFYLHIEPRTVFVGAGTWHPDGDALAKIRAAIAADPKGWKRAISSKRFAGRFELSGESLVRAPRGFDPEHALIEDLKRKDFIGVARLSQKAVTEPGFLSEFVKMCRDGSSLVQFLCEAIDVPF